MKEKKTTIHDIAKSLQINASTVSRALRDQPNVKEETKQLVRKEAKRLNYQPNRMASGLRSGKGHTIGVIVPRLNRNFFAQIIDGIEQVTHKEGYQIVICQSMESFERECASLQTLLHHRVDGVLISVSKETRTSMHLRALYEEGIPVVQFDRVINDFPSPRVVNDDVKIGEAIVHHLFKQGYQRIGYLGGPLSVNVYANRYEGYCRGLALYGKKPDPRWVSLNTLVEDNSKARVLEWYKEAKAPDALFAASDYAALGASMALKSLNIPIPQSVGLVGYANESFTPHMYPPLSSVDQQSQDIGRQSAHLLLDILQGKPFQDVEVKISPKLIFRASSQR